MTDTVDDHLAAAADRLDAFAAGPARAAAEGVAGAFDVAGKRISGALTDAARSGELSLSRLAASIVRDLSGLAIERYVTRPLDGAIQSFAQTLFGARSGGGPVVPGGAYLVGERGPELFRPAVSGAIESGAGLAGPPVQIHIHMPAGAALSEARKSASQVATTLARAVERGRRLP